MFASEVSRAALRTLARNGLALESVGARGCAPERTKSEIHRRLPAKVHWKSVNPLGDAIDSTKVRWKPPLRIYLEMPLRTHDF